MSSLAHAKTEPKEQFFKQLKNNHTVMLGFEIAKANATGEAPDIGVRNEIAF